MEPIDLDAIAAALVDVGKVIGRLKADLADTVTCLRNERKRFAELLAERDAEIARLTALVASGACE